MLSAIEPVTSSTSTISVLTKLSEASQLTETGNEPKPNRFITTVGIVVSAATRTTPGPERLITGVNPAVPYSPCGKLKPKKSLPVASTSLDSASSFITRRAARLAASHALCILLLAI